MANITETSPSMSDAAVKTGVRINFAVLDHDDPKAIAVAAGNDREVPNLRDRVFVESVLLPQRSDGRNGGAQRVTQAQHVDASNYASLNVTALLAALKIIHDVDRARENLA